MNNGIHFAKNFLMSILHSTAKRFLSQAVQSLPSRAMLAQKYFLSCILSACLLCFMMIFSQKYAIAATWQWDNTAAGERITLNLDAAEIAQSTPQIKRTDLNTVFVPLTTVTSPPLVENFSKGENALVANFRVSSAQSQPGVDIQLQDSAFGFLVRRPKPQQIIIDFFKDPLGARWKADGTLAPQGTKVQKLPVVTESVENEPETLEEQKPSMPPEASASQELVLAEQELPVQGASGALNATNEISQDIENEQEIVKEQEVSVDEQKIATLENEVPIVHQEVIVQEQEPSMSTQETLAPEQDASVVTQEEPALAQSEQFQEQTTENASAVATVENNADQEESTLTASFLRPVGEANAATLSTTENQEVDTPQENTEKSEVAVQANIISPQELKGTINKAGPQDWPDGEGINTSLSNDQQGEGAQSFEADSGEGVVSEPQTATEAQDIAAEPSAQEQEGAQDIAAEPSTEQPTQASAQDTSPDDIRQSIDPASKPASAQEQLERPVIYVDEEGNEVPKPLDPEELFADALKLLDQGNIQDALRALEELKIFPGLARDRYEQILYLISDIIADMYEGKALEGFNAIERTTSEALNANLRSARVPDALYRLGVAHLNVQNFAEAEGYFKALKRRFPYDPNVPTAFYLLAEEQFKSKMFDKAAKNFRDVIEEYPDATSLQEATVGLVKALTSLKNFDEAALFADFADKRWPRHYVDEPYYLNYLAEIDYANGKKDAAQNKYWLLYNLEPKGVEAPNILARIGDLYFEQDKPNAALEVFSEVQMRFPDTEAAALALLRSAEKGMYDSPINKAAMFAVFEQPGSPLPQVAYATLQEEYAKNPRSITAKLKYALWQLWNKEYTDAMGTAADFIDIYPENIDVEVARDVIMSGFMADLKNSLLEENYGRVLTLWNGFPLVRQRYGTLDADLRNALARGYLERGDDAKALELFAEFLKEPKHPRYSDPTFALYFNKYLETGNWNGMLDLGEIVKDWEMTTTMRGQLDYALALSAENLGLREKSLEIWKTLAQNMNIPLYQRAYATYFLAKDAELRRDIQDAYAFNLKTLELFEELKEERSDRADDARRKEAMGALMDITEVANRIPEAIEWVDRYNQFVDKESPEHPGLRFREARLYRKLGNNERAKLILEGIVRDSASSPFAAAAQTELGTFNVSRDLQNFLPKSGQ